jgi:hypothetical protein
MVIKYLAFVYGALLPFTSVFAISGLITLPVILSLIFFVFIGLFHGHRLNNKNLFVILSFILLLFISSFSAQITDSTYNKNFLPHLFSYIFVILFFYYVSVRVISTAFNFFLTGCLVGFIISLTFGAVEFVLVQYGFHDVVSSIPRNAREIYIAEAFGFIRIRSLMDESGFFALYLCILGPVLYTLKIRYFNSFLRKLLILLYIINMTLTFSTSAILSFGIILPFVIMAYGKNISYKVIYILLSSIVAILSINLLNNTLDIYMLDIISSKIETGNGRWGPLVTSYNAFINSSPQTLLFGFGAGYGGRLNIDPVMSLVLLMLFELGIVGLVWYLFIFYLAFKNVSKINVIHRPYMAFSILSAFFFYIFISNYWFPWVWVILALLINYQNVPFLRNTSITTNK